MKKWLGLSFLLLLLIVGYFFRYQLFYVYFLLSTPLPKPPPRNSDPATLQVVPNQPIPPSPAVQKKLAAAAPIMQWAREAPDRQSVLVYNAEFAKRFGLDEQQAQALGEGLYAIELVVRKRKRPDVLGIDYPDMIFREMPDKAHDLLDTHWRALATVAPHAKDNMPFIFLCDLNLYVASDLKIQYPYDSRISNWKLSMGVDGLARRFIEANEQTPGFKTSGNNNMYAIFRDKIKNSFENRALIGNRLTQDYRFWQDATIYYNAKTEYYKKNWQPGINYLALRPVIGCEGLVDMQKEAYLLLEKEGRKFYGGDSRFVKGFGRFQQSSVNIDDFYTYRLPEKLLHAPILEKAAKREDNSITLDRKHNMFYMNNR